MIKTAEFVTPNHPDKICDRIADAIYDAYRSSDPASRSAIEVMGGHGLIVVNGEVTSTTEVNVEHVVKNIVGENYKVVVNLTRQSPEISRGVDGGGAGDQGIMKGYATGTTESMMPREYELARMLAMKIYEVYPYDGKTQVTLDGEKVIAVVASFQNAPHDDLLAFVRKYITADTYHINPAGDWHQGGFDADTGLSGRKIIIDNYGPQIPVGGGSFSGKDYTKVDRSGAYMARKIACDYVRKGAHEVFVSLAYAIGVAEPVMAVALVDGKEETITSYDLTPGGIHTTLGLEKIKYADTAAWGHFGRKFPWD